MTSLHQAIADNLILDPEKGEWVDDYTIISKKLCHRHFQDSLLETVAKLRAVKPDWTTDDPIKAITQLRGTD